jgi:hypothetical protein
MKKLIAIFSVLAMFSAAAFAQDPTGARRQPPKKYRVKPNNMAKKQAVKSKALPRTVTGTR